MGWIADGTIRGLMYALLASGFALVYGTSRVLNLGYGALYVLGGLFASSVFASIPLGSWVWRGVVATVAAAVLAGLAGLAFHRFVKMVPGQSGRLLLSLAGFVVAINVLAIIWGTTAVIIDLDPTLAHRLLLGRGVYITAGQQMTAVIGSVLILITLAAWHSTPVLVVRAVADDSQLATIFGVNARKYEYWACAAGFALAGVAGALQAMQSGMEPYGPGLDALIVAAVAVIAAGPTNLLGTAVIGMPLGLVGSLIAVMGKSTWQEPAFLSLLLLFLLFRPYGIGAASRRVEEA